MWVRREPVFHGGPETNPGFSQIPYPDTPTDGAHRYCFICARPVAFFVVSHSHLWPIQYTSVVLLIYQTFYTGAE